MEYKIWYTHKQSETAHFTLVQAESPEEALEISIRDLKAIGLEIVNIWFDEGI